MQGSQLSQQSDESENDGVEQPCNVGPSGHHHPGKEPQGQQLVEVEHQELEHQGQPLVQVELAPPVVAVADVAAEPAGAVDVGLCLCCCILLL